MGAAVFGVDSYWQWRKTLALIGWWGLPMNASLAGVVHRVWTTGGRQRAMAGHDRRRRGDPGSHWDAFGSPRTGPRQVDTGDGGHPARRAAGLAAGLGLLRAAAPGPAAGMASGALARGRRLAVVGASPGCRRVSVRARRGAWRRGRAWPGKPPPSAPSTSGRWGCCGEPCCCGTSAGSRPGAEPSSVKARTIPPMPSATERSSFSLASRNSLGPPNR